MGPIEVTPTFNYANPESCSILITLQNNSTEYMLFCSYHIFFFQFSINLNFACSEPLLVKICTLVCLSSHILKLKEISVNHE